MLAKVVEDVVEEVAGVLAGAVELDRGLAHALRQGLTAFWSSLVADQVNLRLVQGELLHYSLRKPGQEGAARRQYRRYADMVAGWGERAASLAGEECALPFDRLARIMLAAVDGLIVQYVCEPDDDRAWADLEVVIDMLVAAAGIRQAA